MPLVWEITNELKQWLTPEKLRALNERWHEQGGGHAEAVIDDLASLLTRPDIHYESILGYLELQFRRHRPVAIRRDYHALYSWLIEMIYFLLYYRHTNNAQQIEGALSNLDGINHFAEGNAPLWVFTLNHDIIIECVAAKHNIALTCGFSSEVITLPRRDAKGAKTADLRAEVITGQQLETAAMQFLPSGSPGINLLKIHGGLDQFTFRNGKDLLRVLPDENSVSSLLRSLRIANEELFYLDEGGRKPKASNEIAYADDEGEMQFLRRCLLSGAFKFDPRRDQVLPKKMLDHFSANINFLSCLVCIGYGFGDNHINQIIREWLEFSGERRIEIVGPGVTSVPPFLLHLAPQVTLFDAKASDYLDRSAGITRTRTEVLRKRFSVWARSRPKEDVNEEFGAFLQKHMEDVVRTIAEKVLAMPKRQDGDVDLTAIGMTPGELANQILTEVGPQTEDGLLEAFLERLENPPAKG